MPSVGPALPPSLQQKRKRDGESEGTNSKPSSSRSSSDADGTKKQRILGPSLPPAPLEQMPEPPPGQSSRNPQNDSSSDESDFGPAPGPPAESSETVHTTQQGTEVTEAESTSEPRKPQREEWMLAPPTHGDWTSRVDPTKLRNRKFNTGKGARTPNQSNSTDNRLWTETPEQKKQRLEDEVLGKKKMAQMDSGPQRPMRNEAEDRETEKRIREYNVRLAWTVCRILADTVLRVLIAAHRSTRCTRRNLTRLRKTTPASEHSTKRKT